jgi:secondary thiamine-phosphate synthase enzyme
MEMFQEAIRLKQRKRGLHLITTDIIEGVPKIKEMSEGICHVFIRHTSASLTINENADPTVRKDLENWLNNMMPENYNYLHDDEGSDDMPAHIKASVLGSSVTVPVNNGRLVLGTWQGIYLCEHRNNGAQRDIVVTVWGNRIRI